MRLRLVWLTLAVVGATFLAGRARAQENRSAMSVSDSPTPAPASGTARLQLESERVLAASPPVGLLRIGEQIVLLSSGNASVLSADGDARPIAGGRDVRDFGTANDAGLAYVIGGLASNQPAAEVWRVGLDAKGLEWTRITALPAPCPKPAAIIIGGDLFVAGRTETGVAFFVRIKMSGGTVEGLEPAPEFKEAKSLGTQGDSLYLGIQDRFREFRELSRFDED